MENVDGMQKNDAVVVGESQAKVEQILSGAGSPVNSPQLQIKYAGFWIRWVANFVDGLVLLVPTMIVSGVVSLIFGLLGYGTGMDEEISSFIAGVFGFILTSIMSWSYFIFMTYKYKATLGKMALGIQVMSDKSANLTLGQIALREIIGKFVSAIILYIGYIMAGFTEKKQALHDMISNTVVVYKDPSKKNNGCVIAGVIVGCGLPIILAIIGIFTSIVLVSLSSARDKASDAGIKANIGSIISDALKYIDANSTYEGYKIEPDFKPMTCSGDPILNISIDGKQMAIFMKSCQDETKYFCGNPETGSITNEAEIDEDDVKGGLTTCNSIDIPETTNLIEPIEPTDEVLD